MDEIGTHDILGVWLADLLKDAPLDVGEDLSTIDAYREGSENVEHLLIRVWSYQLKDTQIELFKGMGSTNDDVVEKFSVDLRDPGQLSMAEDKILRHVEKYT